MKSFLRFILKGSVIGIAALFMLAQVSTITSGSFAFAAAATNQNSRNSNGVENSNRNNATKSATTAHVATLQGSSNDTNASPVYVAAAPAETAAIKNTTASNAKVTQAPEAQKAHEKVIICHRTAAVTNPYVQIEVDRAAVDGIAGNSNGNQPDHYGEHVGAVFSTETASQKNWGDIIPPVSGAHNGLNWSTAGQSIFNNQCNVATSPQNPSKPSQPAKPEQPANNAEKVTLCHATGSTTNPYVRITISTSGVYNGHLGHQDKRDIIPPFTYDGKSYSANWDSNGQAIYNNDCKQPAVAPASTDTTEDNGQILSAAVTTAPSATELAKTGATAIIGMAAGLALIATSVGLTLFSRTKNS